MRKLLVVIIALLLFTSCGRIRTSNQTAQDEQEHTELNQRKLNSTQPAPEITWSLERDNLIKRFKLMNDRSVVFYMYVFNQGSPTPIGYYMVNKVSSVNSQLTNPEQLVNDPNGDLSAGSRNLPSPAEDGSYGTNGDGVFGFTPEGNYIEHNMPYVVSMTPLKFLTEVPLLNPPTKETKVILDDASKVLSK